MKIPALCFGLALFAWLPGAFAAEDATTMTVEDVVSSVDFGEMAFSPDGHWLVWLISRSDETVNRRVGDLYRLDLREKGAVARRLTNGPSDDSSPRWSPDSRWVAFLSRRTKEGEEKAKTKTQIWRIPVDGGEAEVLTKWPAGVLEFRWAADGRILFTAEEGPTEYDRGREKAKDDVRVVEDRDHWKAVRLFAFDPQTKKVRRLTDNEDRIEGFWLRRDGLAVVTRQVVSVYDGSQVAGPRPKYFLRDFETATVREILEEEIFDPTRVEFSSDGTHLYAEWYYSRLHSDKLKSSAGIHTLWSVDLEGGERRRIALGDEMGLAGNVRNGSWQVIDGGLVAAMANRTTVRLLRIDERGDRFDLRELRGEGLDHWFGLAVDASGTRIAGVHSRADDPHALVVGRLRGTRVRESHVVHDPNAALGRKLTRSEVIHWKSSKDGVEIDGILHYPKGFDAAPPGRRWPLMLWIHGGPAGVDADQFENYWASFPHLLAQRGMFVLQPNYRGSSNHGLDYVEAITQGKYYRYEIPDILSGVDELIERGWVHPDSLGTKGWSNGSILTIALTIESDRFKVACAGAGDVNWTSDFGNCAFGPNFDVTYFGTTPWEDPARYVELSPFFRLAEVRTPTLIQFGEKDTSVPTEQGWQHYRALQMLDRAAVRFLVYPGMGHGLTKLSYRRRKIQEDLGWIDRHLFGRSPDAGEELRKGSPLDLVLAQAGLPHVGSFIGVEDAGVLVPPVERVAPESPVAFGRTEVTRAQFEVFLRSPEAEEVDAGALVGWDPQSRAFGPSTGNLPVTGVSAEAAEAYTQWLSQRTGHSWRLPTAAEWEEVAGRIEELSVENNLCRWAGYSPTPEEADALRARIARELDLPKLLREVAVSGAKSDLKFFDLHGNATEWTRDSGELPPRLKGRSVIDSCDGAAMPRIPTDTRLYGLRVVREVSSPSGR